MNDNEFCIFLVVARYFTLNTARAREQKYWNVDFSKISNISSATTVVQLGHVTTQNVRLRLLNNFI